MAGTPGYVLTAVLVSQQVSDLMAGEAGSVLTAFTPTVVMLTGGE